MLARARQADADVGMLALPGPIDDATHHGDRHLLDAVALFAPFGHAVANEPLDFLGEFLEVGARRAATAGACDDHGREGPQAHGLQYFLRNDDFLGAIAARLGRQRDANRVADAFLQQNSDRGGGRDDALAAHARFGQPQVQRVIAARRQIAVDRNQVLDATDFGADDDLVGAQPQGFGALRAVEGRDDDRLAHDIDRGARLRQPRVLVHHPGQ